MGSNPTEKVLSYKNDKIFVPGFIHDVRPYFDRAKIFLSPLRYGAGMKGKIGHSMSAGLPVITTTVGAEGVGLDDGVNTIVRDDLQEFVTAVCSFMKMKQVGIAYRRTVLSMSRNSHRQSFQKK